MATRQTVAVLTGKGSTRCEDQIRNFTCDPGHLNNLTRLLEIDEGTDVETPDRAMTVIASIYIVAFENVSKSLHELRQLGRVDGRVLHKGNGLFLPLHSQQKTQTVFT